MKIWIVYGIQFNFYNDTALILAAYLSQLEIVELLLEQEGIDVNIKNSDI